MNYQAIHDAIILNAQSRIKPDCYVEEHHIIPYCFTKDNSPSNLVDLTAREHYLIHHLLYKIYQKLGNKKKIFQMSKAWHAMCFLKTKDQERIVVKSHQYEACKKAHSEAMSNRIVSEETRLKISAVHKNKITSKETKIKLSKAAKSRVCSEKTKAKMSLAQLNRSDESKQKQSATKKGKPAHNKNKPMSEETKKKMSEKKKIYWMEKKKNVEV